MPISTTCPNCKAIFRLPDELAGKKAQCAKCNQLFMVPDGVGATISAGVSVPSVASVPEATIADAPVAHASGSENSPPPPPIASPPPLPTPAEMENDADDRRSAGAPPPLPKEARKSAEPPRGEKPAKKSSGALAIVLALVGLCLFMCVACAGVGLGGYVLFPDAFKKKGPQMVRDGSIPVTFGPAGAFTSDNNLAGNDKRNRDNKLHKAYTVHMEVNRTYEIDLISNNFDAFLYLVDPDGNVVARDDDGGQGLNSRISFRPNRPGAYRIEATSLGGQSIGAYRLVVQRR